MGRGGLLRGQGRVALALGEWRQAEASYRESLFLLHERGVREAVPDCLEGIAAALVAAAPASPGHKAYAQSAARLLGAAEAMREAMGAPLPPVYSADHERMFVRLRAVLGEQGVSAAWREGREMELPALLAACGVE